MLGRAVYICCMDCGALTATANAASSARAELSCSVSPSAACIRRDRVGLCTLLLES